MNIEQQVVSLELSEKLKEAGYKQEGIWYWYRHKQLSTWELGTEFGKDKNEFFDEANFVRVTAPTITELISKTLLHSNIEWKIFFGKDKCIIYSAGTYGFHSPDLPQFVGINLQECLAKMWLYLKERGLV